MNSENPNSDRTRPANPFDPASLRLGQDFASSVGVKKVLTTVPCRKPNRHEWIRVRPGEEWRLETAIFEDQVSKEAYVVSRDLWSELGTELSPVCLFLVINRQGGVFLWSAKLPKSEGRSNLWHETALKGAKLAEQNWTKIMAMMELNMYETPVSTAEWPDPVWPDLDFGQILDICFRGRRIDSCDHPLLRELRGER